MEYIYEGAFGECINLEAFYGKYASDDNRCLIVNDVLIAFAPSGVTEYKIPDSVTYIGLYSFYGCPDLKSVTIPDSVTYIRFLAFALCVNLEAFYGKYASDDNRCLIVDGDLIAFAPSGLAEYEIPNNATSIGEYAFYGCTKLESVTMSNSVTAIGEHSFQYCYGMNFINIGDSVTTIDNGAFRGCISLTSVTIPDSVTSIGISTFNECINLTSASIGNSVTCISSYAFAYCFKLTSVIIGSSVTSLEEGAFLQCWDLTSVEVAATNPPTCEDYCFYEVPVDSAKLYVPTESVGLYKKADQWREFGKIVGKNFTGVEETLEDKFADVAAPETPVEYFNLQGVRVENPTNGLYIRRVGNRTSKVVIN